MVQNITEYAVKSFLRLIMKAAITAQITAKPPYATDTSVDPNVETPISLNNNFS